MLLDQYKTEKFIKVREIQFFKWHHMIKSSGSQSVAGPQL